MYRAPRCAVFLRGQIYVGTDHPYCLSPTAEMWRTNGFNVSSSLTAKGRPTTRMTSSIRCNQDYSPLRDYTREIGSFRGQTCHRFVLADQSPMIQFGSEGVRNPTVSASVSGRAT